MAVYEGENMSDLVEFLRARLDEDAKREWWEYGRDGSSRLLDERLLAEVATKRRIIEDLGPSRCAGWREPGDRPDHYADHYPDEQAYPCDGCSAAESADRQWTDFLRRLASVYTDHPDYREEWKP